VEGEVFHVHSYVLMSQSSVFHQMMAGGMSEAQSGRITLAGKSKSEFQEFLHILQRSGSAPLLEMSEDVARWLVVWADEYNVVHLRARCEEVLVQSLDKQPGWEELEFAVKYKLEKLRKAWVFQARRDLFPYRHRLLELLKHSPLQDSDDDDDDEKEQLESEAVTREGTRHEKEPEKEEQCEHDLFVTEILPYIYWSVFLDLPDTKEEAPSHLSVEALWPIVVRSLELARGWSDLAEVNAAAKRAASLEDTILNMLPHDFGRLRCSDDKKLAARDVHAKCKASASTRCQQEVDDALSILERKGIIKKIGAHLAKDCNATGYRDFMGRGFPAAFLRVKPRSG
jgi:hypothetical protein